MKLQNGILTIVAGSALFITSCKCDGTNTAAVTTENEDIDTVVTTTEIAKLDEDGNYLYDVGEISEIALPDGSKMSVGKNSTESKLFSQLSDTNFVVSDDKTQGWVTLDRVYFPTGQADLSSNSETQVANIVTLLKLFPNSTVKVGGYTDNVGDASVNQTISTNRAKSVADQIVASGIEATRVESEGYGADHFVCAPNDTDECKAQNRRVDIRVTKK